MLTLRLDLRLALGLGSAGSDFVIGVSDDQDDCVGVVVVSAPPEDGER